MNSKTDIIRLLKDHAEGDIKLSAITSYIECELREEEKEKVRSRLADFNDVKESKPKIHRMIQDMFDSLGCRGCEMAYRELTSKKTKCPIDIHDRVVNTFKYFIDEWEYDSIEFDPAKKRQAKRTRTSSPGKDEKRQIRISYLEDEVPEDKLVKYWNEFMERKAVLDEIERQSVKMANDFKYGDAVKCTRGKDDDENQGMVHYGVICELDVEGQARAAFRTVHHVGDVPDWTNFDGKIMYSHYVHLERVLVDTTKPSCSVCAGKMNFVPMTPGGKELCSCVAFL
jgi:hypothetical protein